MKNKFILLFLSIYVNLYAQLDCFIEKQPPKVETIALSSIILDNGVMEIFALDYVIMASDNCTNFVDLIFTFDGANPVPALINEPHYFNGHQKLSAKKDFDEGNAQLWNPTQKTSSKKTFKCKGPSFVTVWDKRGNHTSSRIQCTIIDPKDTTQCSGINFLVENVNGLNINDVFLKMSASHPEYPKFYIMDGYRSELIFDFITCYFILNDKNDSNGITTKDVLAVRNHILGIKKFTTPYQFLAADVNGDEKITTTDLKLIRKMSLGLLSKFSVPSWLFIPKNLKFQEVSNPWLEKSKWEANSSNVENFFCRLPDKTQPLLLEYLGIKLGDVDGSAY